jgi:Glycosyl transferase family 2
MRKTIGVAIATYNGARYLQEQLDSITAQSEQPDMISVSDDASTDDTFEILSRFKASSAIPVVIHRNAQQTGVIKNFQQAFEQCGTDYIAYCDQDDVWDRDKVACYRDVLRFAEPALVFHKSDIVDSDLRSTGRCEPFNVRPGSYTFPHLPHYLWGFGHQMLFSKAVLEQLKDIQASTVPGVAQVGKNLDMALIVAAGMQGDIHFIDKALIKFRRHPNSVSPAAKQAVATPDRAETDERKLAIARHLDMIQALMAHVQAMGSSLPGAQSARYEAHLRQQQAIYQRRLGIYTSPAFSVRLSALGALVLGAAYGQEHRNKLPWRHLLIDTLRALSGHKSRR